MTTTSKSNAEASTLNRTSTTRMPIPGLGDTGADTDADSDTPPGYIGYQFCDLCRNHGHPQTAPRSHCDCHKIVRGVGRSNRFSKKFDTIIRIAEQAVLSLWTQGWQQGDITITSAKAVGRKGDSSNEPDIHDIKVEFDGTLWRDLTKQYTCEAGSAEIAAITDDGALHIDVTPTQKTTQ